MAQQMLNLGGDLSPEQALQQQQIARQQQMAQLLMQQGQQTPSGQMVGNRYVAPSFFQYAAPLLQGYVGKKQLEKAEAEQLNLAKAIREQGASEVADIINTYQGRAAKPAPMGYELVDAGTPAVAPNPQKALAQATVAGPYGRALLPAILKNALPEPVKPTIDMQNFEFAKTQGFKGSFTDYKNQITPYQQAQLNFDREKFEFEKQNKAGGKDLTEAQGKASAFQSQMVSASNVAKNLESSGFDPTLLKSQTAVKLAGGTANPLVPVTAQQYKQAQDQWSEAYLRFKTGAAATEQEVQRNNRTFFPVFGDKPDQVAQKAAMREQAEKDVGIAAGRGAGLGAQPTAPIAKPESKPSIAQQLGLSKVPKGVDPKVWNVMTPEEKALFK
jgi:hypothetical protein